MAFEFSGMLLDEYASRALRPSWRRAVVMPFERIDAVPLTGELFVDLVPRGWDGPPRAGFEFLAPGLEQVLANASTLGAIAFVEMNCFGGVCDQAAIAWSDGEIAGGPWYLDDDNRAEMSDRPTPFSLALRALGVVAEDGADEFDTIGFRRWRGTWVPDSHYDALAYRGDGDLDLTLAESADETDRSASS